VPFEACGSAMETIEGADALLILTEWQEFRSINLNTLKLKMNQALIFDGRNLLRSGKNEKLGIEYYGIGRQVRSSNIAT